MSGHLGIIVVREHRDMAEHVVEAVGRLEIVELLARADEIADREHPFAEHREEHVIGNKPGNRDRAPAGAWAQDRVQPVDVGHAGVRQLEQADPVEERRDHAASEQLDLAREQQVPHRMVVGGERLPILRDDIILPASGPVVLARSFPGAFRISFWSWATKNPPRRPGGSRLVSELTRASAGPNLVGIIISGAGRAAVHCVAL